MALLPPSLLVILDEDDYGSFIRQFSGRVPFDLKKWFLILMKTECSEQNYQSLHTLARFILVERQNQSYGTHINFSITSEMEAIQELIFMFHTFIAMEVPFGNWSELFKETKHILGGMLEENVNINKSEKTVKLKEQITQALSPLLENPEMQHRYCDFFNGAG